MLSCAMNGRDLLVYLKEALPYSQLEIFPKDSSLPLEALTKLDSNTLKTLYYYVLSEDEKVTENIKYFLDLTINKKKFFINYFVDNRLEKIYRKAQQVRREIHKMKGLLRFREVNGGYLYASFRPDNNIILPLARYFANRMRNEKILIHDTRRNLIVFCHRERVYPAKLEDQVPDFTENEKVIQRLWIEYFDKIAIKERLNIKLQKQKVPQKYRSFVIEFMKEYIKK